IAHTVAAHGGLEHECFRRTAGAVPEGGFAQAAGHYRYPHRPGTPPGALAWRLPGYAVELEAAEEARPELRACLYLGVYVYAVARGDDHQQLRQSHRPDDDAGRAVLLRSTHSQARGADAGQGLRRGLERQMAPVDALRRHAVVAVRHRQHGTAVRVLRLESAGCRHRDRLFDVRVL